MLIFIHVFLLMEGLRIVADGTSNKIIVIGIILYYKLKLLTLCVTGFMIINYLQFRLAILSNSNLPYNFFPFVLLSFRVKVLSDLTIE